MPHHQDNGDDAPDIVIDLRSGRSRGDATCFEDVVDVPGPAACTVLHICTRFVRGGSEQRLVDMIQALPDLLHVVVIGEESDHGHAKQRLSPASVIVEPSLSREVNPHRDLTALVRLRQLIRQLQPAVVVTHQSKAGALGRLAAGLAGRFVTVHSLSMADFGSGYGAASSGTFRLIEHLLSSRTSAYAVVGRDLADQFQRVGVPESRLHVIRSGALLPDASAVANRRETKERAATQCGLPFDRPWVLYIGSLEVRKGVLELPILMQQTLQFSPEDPPFFVLAGGGPEIDTLRTRIEQIGIDHHCALLGHVKDPRTLFVGSDAVVLLSRVEGLPQVLVQSAAAGTPFVSTEVHGVDELLALGAVGTVVEPGDVVGAARALLSYLRRPEQRDGACVNLTSWDHEHIKSEYRRLFASLLGENHSESGLGVAQEASSGAVVAVIGSDGSGKSTLAHGLVDRLTNEHDVRYLYLGSGDGPSSLLRWPMKRAKQALFGKGSTGLRQRHTKGGSSLGLRMARVVWALALAREKQDKLSRARRLAADGVIVICDRYPQAQLPATTDGPLLDPWKHSSSRWRRALGRYEAKSYDRAHDEMPDLVIRLTVDQQTAIERRPSHSSDDLAKRRDVVRRLNFDGARLGVVEIDGRRPADEVLELAQHEIELRLSPQRIPPP